jgi:Zn-dependent protease
MTTSFLSQLPLLALTFLLFLPAIILHEVSHGYVAYMLGDPTAKMRGRLTLNPISHIDPFGTLLLPVLMLLLSGGTTAFGYAKPVPINPYNFRGDKRWGMLLTGAAGPAMNLAIATVFGLALRVALPLLPNTNVGQVVVQMWGTFVFLNLMLMSFNLIPLPPLDGSRVVQYFLPDGALRVYEQIERYGFLVILAVLFLIPGALTGYLNVTAIPLFKLITGLAA